MIRLAIILSATLIVVLSTSCQDSLGLERNRLITPLDTSYHKPDDKDTSKKDTNKSIVTKFNADSVIVLAYHRMFTGKFLTDTLDYIWHYSSINCKAVIDTSVSNPAVFLSLSMIRDINDSTGNNTLFERVQEYKLTVDSLSVATKTTYSDQLIASNSILLETSYFKGKKEYKTWNQDQYSDNITVLAQGKKDNVGITKLRQIIIIPEFSMFYNNYFYADITIHYHTK